MRRWTFFDHIPRIKRKLLTLANVGLGYIHLGQQATTLSGGEAQRVKLSTELSKVATGKTLYILDEPTTGLHFEDIRMLLDCAATNLVESRQHGGGDRAQSRCHQDGRLDYRSRPGGGRRRGTDYRHRDAGTGSQGQGFIHR